MSSDGWTDSSSDWCDIINTLMTIITTTIIIIFNYNRVDLCVQCQKFGDYHKDDPNSFRFSETFSLYPQVICIP